MRNWFPEHANTLENQVIKVIQRELRETLGTPKTFCARLSCDADGSRVLHLARFAAGGIPGVGQG